MVHPGDEVLDMGCGSGILSVAAALLGAKSVTGVDIEEDSIRVSKENAARNGLSSEEMCVSFWAMFCKMKRLQIE